ncbi:MAG TPA: hypothetical protein VNX21_08120 [Candidatus Thermoplasmatota archaeon]|nr:hypothetical protein [Candidatus Thermoplasmatota archaeon]
MRIVLILACVLVLAGVGVALAPAASACTGDPSVCGVLRDVKCTQREGVEDALEECWQWVA